MKKSIKYQELLDINDNKKKRLSTLNSKIGAVVRISLHQVHTKAKIYVLLAEDLPRHLFTPPTREGHTTIIYRNSAIVIGGHCSTPFAQGHVYSLNSNTWTKQFNIPSARSYHSTVLYKDRYAVIFGGMGPYDMSRKCRVCYNSVNIIDLSTMNTRPLKMSGEALVGARR
jgi:hypothetical protein